MKKAQANYFLFRASFCIGLLCCLFRSALSASINQNNDLQLWVSGEVHKQFSSRTYLDVRNEYRFGNNMSEFYLTFIRGIFSFHWNSWLKTDPGYCQSWVKRSSHFRMVYEPMINFTFQKPHKWDVRQRIAYQFAEEAPNRWVYRVRLRLLSEFFPLSPYASNEIFMFSKGGHFENRSQIGIRPPLYRNLSSDFYYILRLIKDPEWVHHHILGARLTANF